MKLFYVITTYYFYNILFTENLISSERVKLPRELNLSSQNSPLRP